MKRILGSLILVCALVTDRAFGQSEPAPVVPESSAPTAEQVAFFETHVRPLLVEHCFKCHGAGKHKGNLQLDNRSLLLAGGDSGAAIIPGKPAESLLIQAVNYDGYEMPPGQKLPAEKIALLTRWVEMGAPWPGSAGEAVTPVRKGGEITEEDRHWWAFQPIVAPPVPTPDSATPIENPIDAFVLEQLQARQLSANPPASARVLIRRAFFDLLGLPPTPEEMAHWQEQLQDSAHGINQAAWSHLIDDLLARPQYGERWGRHWLDVVRFAQTNGYERDREKSYAWRYRDYVVNALNADKPYDRFLIEQLAGDELPDASDETRIATGFYRLGLWDDEPDDSTQAEFDDLDDIMVASSAAFLGLTMGCARCHDHKFDPIRHQDYYALLAYFRNIQRYSYAEHQPESTSLLPLGSREQIEASIAKRAERWAELDSQIAAVEQSLAADKQATEAASPEAAKPEQQQLQERAKREQDNRNELERLKKLRAGKTVDGLEWAMAVRERGATAPVTHVLIRGNAQTPGDEVQPAIPGVLGEQSPEIVPPERAAPFQTSGRRLALARWLTNPQHPLTARVIANRVWHYHFGRGIVATTGDFGKVGSPPTHPALLDWLAATFQSQGWSIKQLHRQIMLSQAYQRSSDHINAQANQVDPGNTLLWRQNLHRLDAEAIRDTLLTVAGTLNPEMGGRGYFPLIGAEALSGGTVPGVGWELSSDSQRQRRSLYTFIKRSLVSPQLDTFDYANTSLPLTERPVTTVAPQALTLLNDEFVQQQAAAFAARVTQEAGETELAQIQRAFQLALNREPTSVEAEIASQFLQQQRSEFAQLQSRLMIRPLVPVTIDSGYLKQLAAAEMIDVPGAGWQPLRGVWNGTTLDLQRSPAALWKGVVCRDASITCTVTLGNASELGALLARATPTGDFVTGYELLLDARNSRLALVRHGKNPEVLSEVTVNIPTGVPLPVVWSLSGDHQRAEVTIGGTAVVLEAIDPQPLSQAGQIGVRTWGAAIFIDDLNLQTGELAWDVARAQVGDVLPPASAPWSEYGGDWQTSEEGIIRPHHPNGGGKIVANEVVVGDGTLEVDVRVQGPGDAGLLLRVNGESTGTDALSAYNINFLKSQLRLGKHENNWRQLVAVPCEFSATEWTHVRVDIHAGHLEIFVGDDPQPKIDYVDPAPLPPGKVGFRTFHCQAEFRQLAVRDARGDREIDVRFVSPANENQVHVSGTRTDSSQQQALQALCLLILNLNEMIYVE